MSLEHSPAREGAAAVAISSGQDAPSDPLEGRLAVSPKVMCQVFGCGLTRGYEIINNGEVESYKDGRSRKITTRSIRARQQRLIEAARAARTTPATPDSATGG